MPWYKCFTKTFFYFIFLNSSLSLTSDLSSSMSWRNLKSLSPLSNITSCFFRGGGGGMSGRVATFSPWREQAAAWGGVGGRGAGLHNNNPLPTSLTHTAIPLQLYCIMWPHHVTAGAPPCAIKISFYLHSTRRKLNQKQGAGSRRPLLRAKLAGCGSEASILYQRAAGWVGGGPWSQVHDG